MNSYFKIGDAVNTICADWEWDNPMIVVEEDHNCSCCGLAHTITCKGKSGALYEEIDSAFDKID